jgi:hypothetical protein
VTDHGPVDPSQYPEILERAADILESEKVKWCQGSYFNGRPEEDERVYGEILSACALGSLRLASIDTQGYVIHSTMNVRMPPAWVLRVEDDLNDIISTYLRSNEQYFSADDQFAAVDTFNDRPETTKEDVIEVFKQVAKDLRNAN